MKGRVNKHSLAMTPHVQVNNVIIIITINVIVMLLHVLCDPLQFSGIFLVFSAMTQQVPAV